jgi:RecA-family ATPase
MPKLAHSEPIGNQNISWTGAPGAPDAPRRTIAPRHHAKPPAKTASKLEHARYHALVRGRSVFPLAPNSKVPLLSGSWRYHATTDEARITKWFTENPDANIGIALSKDDIVVDIDPRNGGASTRTVLELIDDFPDTTTVKTAGGGEHRFYVLPHGVRVKNAAGALGPGVDIKTVGGYVVAAGSTINGNSYDWLDDREAATCPQWIIDRCHAPRAKTKSALSGKPVVEEDEITLSLCDDYLARRAPEASEGNRNNTAVVVANRFYDFGATRATCYLKSIEWNYDKCHPPLDEEEIESVVASTEHNRDNPIGCRHPLASGFEAIEAPSILSARSPAAPLKWLDMSNWDNERVPERQWAIKDCVPLKQAGLFSGEGGTGKSILELTKNVAHVIGQPWLGLTPERGPAIYVGAEDDKDEIHIRLAQIARHHGVTFKDLVAGGLHVLPLLGQDATLCFSTGKSGRIEVTDLYRRLYEAAGDIKPKNISVDTLSRAFTGNELDRGQVYAFVMHMQALAAVANGSVTVLSHPSLTGINSGSGISGSTAWHGAFRFRHYLTGIKPEAGEQPGDGLRQLEFKKNQYGPTSDTVVLRYQRGLFLPEAGVSLDKAAREITADETFLALLARFTREGRKVCEKPTAPNYAPAAFSREPDANGIRKIEFTAAMRRLFLTNKIHVESYGPPSRQSSQIVLEGREVA